VTIGLDVAAAPSGLGWRRSQQSGTEAGRVGEPWQVQEGLDAVGLHRAAAQAEDLADGSP
jgi:hypothetical protein